MVIILYRVAGGGRGQRWKGIKGLKAGNGGENGHAAVRGCRGALLHGHAQARHGGIKSPFL